MSTFQTTILITASIIYSISILCGIAFYFGFFKYSSGKKDDKRMKIFKGIR